MVENISPAGNSLQGQPSLTPQQNPQVVSSGPQPLAQNNQPSSPLNGQGVVVSQPFMPDSTGGKVNFAEPDHRRRPWILFSILGGFVLLLVVFLFIYFLVLPSRWSSEYLKNIKPVYKTQSSHMQSVYASLGTNIFNGDNLPVSTVAEEYLNINSSIKSATSSTAQLESKDHLNVLPFTAWNHSVSSANEQYKSMQKYISDSQAFLSDFSTLMQYSQQLGVIFDAQLTTTINNLESVNKGASTATFVSLLSTATGDLQSFINQLKGLKAPPDLTSFNQNLISNLSDLNSALTAQQADLASNNITDFNNNKAVFGTAVQRLVTLLETNPYSTITTNSYIHSQAVSLEKEHPLK